MGLLEERIKQDLIQSIFTDSLKIFESIDSKFKLSNDEKSKVLDMVSQFNQELSTLLKNAKLS